MQNKLMLKMIRSCLAYPATQRKKHVEAMMLVWTGFESFFEKQKKLYKLVDCKTAFSFLYGSIRYNAAVSTSKPLCIHPVDQNLIW